MIRNKSIKATGQILKANAGSINICKNEIPTECFPIEKVLAREFAPSDIRATSRKMDRRRYVDQHYRYCSPSMHLLHFWHSLGEWNSSYSTRSYVRNVRKRKKRRINEIVTNDSARMYFWSFRHSYVPLKVQRVLRTFDHREKCYRHNNCRWREKKGGEKKERERVSKLAYGGKVSTSWRSFKSANEMKRRVWSASRRRLKSYRGESRWHVAWMPGRQDARPRAETLRRAHAPEYFICISIFYGISKCEESS